MVLNWKCIASFPCGVKSEFPTKLMIEKLPFGFSVLNTDVKDFYFKKIQRTTFESDFLPECNHTVLLIIL